MKDVAIYEKPRGGESSHRSEDIRMGKPGGAILRHPFVNPYQLEGNRLN